MFHLPTYVLSWRFYSVHVIHALGKDIKISMGFDYFFCVFYTCWLWAFLYQHSLSFAFQLPGPPCEEWCRIFFWLCTQGCPPHAPAFLHVGMMGWGWSPLLFWSNKYSGVVVPREYQLSLGQTCFYSSKRTGRRVLQVTVRITTMALPNQDRFWENPPGSDRQWSLLPADLIQVLCSDFTKRTLT